MVKILFILLLLFINSNNSYEIIHNITNITNSIEPGISKTFYIEYIKKHNFTFNTTQNDPLQINILSINCKIDVWFESEEKINSININKNHYHFVLDSKNKSFLIEPSISLTPSDHDLIPYVALTKNLSLLISGRSTNFLLKLS